MLPLLQPHTSQTLLEAPLRTDATLRAAALADPAYQAVVAATTTGPADTSSPITARDGILYHGQRV